MKTDKTVVILMGPKGSGKTYVGKLLAQHLDISFLDIEEIVKAIQATGITTAANLITAYAQVEERIDQILEHEAILTFESTGLSEHFWHLHKRLQKRYAVELVGITASPGLCLDRIRCRDANRHIAIDETVIRRLNKQIAALDCSHLMTINTEKMSDRVILRQFRLLFDKQGDGEI